MKTGHTRTGFTCVSCREKFTAAKRRAVLSGQLVCWKCAEPFKKRKEISDEERAGEWIEEVRREYAQEMRS